MCFEGKRLEHKIIYDIKVFCFLMAIAKGVKGKSCWGNLEYSAEHIRQCLYIQLSLRALNLLSKQQLSDDFFIIGDRLDGLPSLSDLLHGAAVELHCGPAARLG